jgi:transcriptional regulator with XRE-family HTH domain
MAVKFIKTIREQLGFTRYKLSRVLNIPTQSVDHWEEKGVAIKPEVLCKLRKLGGLTWGEMGKMLDDEFLDKE